MPKTCARFALAGAIALWHSATIGEIEEQKSELGTKLGLFSAQVRLASCDPHARIAGLAVIPSWVSNGRAAIFLNRHPPGGPDS